MLRTLSLITTSRGQALAMYCTEWKRWTYFADCCFVDIPVISYKPLHYATWHRDSVPPVGANCIVQLETGYYQICYYEAGEWHVRRTNRKLQKKVIRFTRISDMRDGKWKSI